MVPENFFFENWKDTSCGISMERHLQDKQFIFNILGGENGGSWGFNFKFLNGKRGLVPYC